MAESVGLRKISTKTEATQKVSKVEKRHQRMDDQKFSTWLRRKDSEKQKKAHPPMKPGDEKGYEKRESKDSKEGSEEQMADELYSRDGKKEREEERVTGDLGQFIDVLA